MIHSSEFPRNRHIDPLQSHPNLLHFLVDQLGMTGRLGSECQVRRINLFSQGGLHLPDSPSPRVWRSKKRIPGQSMSGFFAPYIWSDLVNIWSKFIILMKSSLGYTRLVWGTPVKSSLGKKPFESSADASPESSFQRGCTIIDLALTRAFDKIVTYHMSTNMSHDTSNFSSTCH